MRTIKRYRFELQCGDKTHTANPIYDKLTKKWKQESNNIFFRHELQGQLQFVGEDYEFIRSCDMAEDILMTIYQDNKKYLDCYFRIVDCEIDVNHKNIKVQPKTKDAYNAILDKYNEEYNLMSHNPKLSDISMDVRPMLQVYTLGADYVMNYIGSTMHKKTVSPIYDMADYAYLNFFDAVGTTAMVTFTKYEEQFQNRCLAAVTTWNTEEDEIFDYLYMYDVEDSTRPYRIRMERGKETMLVYIYFEIYTPTDGWQILYRREPMVEFAKLSSLDSLYMYEISDSDYLEYQMILDFSYNQIYSRLLCRMNNAIQEVNTETDMFNVSSIYNNIIPIRMIENLIVSTATSTEITKYGLVKGETELYYVPTTDETKINEYIPIAENKWNGKFSYWLKYNLKTLEEIYTVQKNLKDWVSMYEVLRVLLKEIDPNIKLSHGSFSSMFLWSKQNPITGLDNQGEPFMLAKSNATTLEYDYSATKTPIKISDVLEWLKTINVYWDIREGADGNKYLRMEHIAFYMNGESYGENAYKHINLKEIYDTRNGKNYAFRTNKWRYENADSMPTTIFYKWADAVSIPFEGEAMKAVKRLSDEKQETRSTGIFTSDIDYVFANSNEVTQDGFIVAQAYKGDGETAYEIQYYDDTIDGRQYHLQNGLLSAIYFQKNYLNYDLAYEQAEVTGGTIVDVKRMKQIRYNEVEFFVPNNIEIDEYTQLTTEVGRGTISDMEQDMSSNKITATLKYPIYNED